MICTLPPRLLVGTANAHKLAEIRAILRGLPLAVVGCDILSRPLEPDESAESFEENARTKALAFARAAARIPAADRPRWVVSDDSGLCVEALAGAPGVRSARYAGTELGAQRQGEGRRDEDNNRKLLEALRDVPPERRAARFVCAVACVEVDGGRGEPRLALEARGECPGTIVDSPRGRGGFGYDPLFLIPSLGRTYAELAEEEKNRLSHRGRAFRLLAERLREALAASAGGHPVPC